MKIGIFGEALAGKSTLLRVLVAQFGYAMDDGKRRKGLFVVNVPDERLDQLEKVFKPRKKVFSTITFQEVAPGSERAIDGRTIPVLSSCDLLLLMVPVFLREELSRMEGALYNYFMDLESEICLADYMVAQKRLERLQKEGRKGREWDLMERVVTALEDSTPLRSVPLVEVEKKILSSFSFLSLVPIIVVVNIGEDDIGKRIPLAGKEKLASNGIETIMHCGKLEDEVMGLDSGEREAFLTDAGLDGYVMNHLLRSSYTLLDLVSFFTIGDDEVRSWSIRKDTCVRDAAGKIHSDLERGFIRAEVISYDEFIEFDDLRKAKSAGKLRLEGKDYKVKDGDIITVRFNV
jgi:GTP-binding protein YchF